MYKKLIIFTLAIFFVTSFAYADEVVTDIGQIQLTDNQIRNWSPSGVWKRFSYINSHVIGVSDSSPQQSDIDVLNASIHALPDTTPQRDIDAQNAQSLDALVQQKIKDIALSELQTDGLVDVDNQITAQGIQAVKTSINLKKGAIQ